MTELGKFFVLRNKATGKLHVPREQSSSTPRLYSTAGRANAATPYWGGDYEVVPVTLTTEGEIK